MRETKVGLVVAAAMVLLFAPLSGAATPDELEANLKQLKGQFADQAKRIERLEERLREERLKRDRQADIRRILKEIRADAPAPQPAWLENLKFSGDLRLRYQSACYNTGRMEDNIGRFRLRFGFTKTWLQDQLEVGFRLASGSSSDPTSSNQTFDNQFSQKDVWIDLAYAKYSPRWLRGATLMGGKMKNPVVHTDMIWDSDVNPEGVWLGYVSPVKIGPIEPFASIGVWVIEHNKDRGDAEVHVYQAGFNWEVVPGVKWVPAITYYDFNNIEQNFSVIGADGNSTSGGRLLAEEFNVLNITNEVKFKVFNLPVSAYFDFAHNCDNEYDGQSDAYAARIKVGKNKKKGDWSAMYKYGYIEANAVVGGFADSDFGGANTKGHRVSVYYNVTKYLVAGVSGFFTEVISGSSDGDTRGLLQADLIWKF
jgi:hypothetical protein